jgi:hypothetical protein
VRHGFSAWLGSRRSPSPAQAFRQARGNASARRRLRSTGPPRKRVRLPRSGTNSVAMRGTRSRRVTRVRTRRMTAMSWRARRMDSQLAAPTAAPRIASQLIRRESTKSPPAFVFGNARQKQTVSRVSAVCVHFACPFQAAHFQVLRSVSVAARATSSVVMANGASLAFSHRPSNFIAHRKKTSVIQPKTVRLRALHFASLTRR